MSVVRQFSGRAIRIQRSRWLADAGYARLIIRLFNRRQSGGFPCFEAAGHGSDVFVAHFLQTLGRECGTSTATTMANDRHVAIGKLFYDLKLKHPATHVHRVRNVLLVPFVLFSNIHQDGFTIGDSLFDIG